MPTPQARYWLCTIPATALWEPVLQGDICYLKGQLEEGGTTGYRHWQVLAVCAKRVTRNQLKGFLCPEAHCEQSRSSAANDYVWKDDTAVPNTRFEIGTLPKSKARSVDWDAVWSAAKSGDIDSIPKDILIRNYTSIKRIRVDNCTPPMRPGIEVRVYWGPTGTGKTHRAFDEAGSNFYIKNSRTKWWDGYQGQPNVIIDEFNGSIDVTYLLNWFDKYPCFAEIKGFSVPLQAVKFWVTSNVEPIFWYQDITAAHRDALLRRLTVVEKMDIAYAQSADGADGVLDTPRGVSRSTGCELLLAPSSNRIIDLDLNDLLSD